MRPDSIRGRLTLGFVGALALLLAGVEGGLYLEYRRSTVGDAQSRLRAAAVIVAKGLHGDPDELEENLDMVGALYGADGIGAAVFDRNGRVLGRTPSGSQPPTP